MSGKSPGTLPRGENEIGEHGTAFPRIERPGVFQVPLSDHLFRGYARHALDRPVPGYDAPVFIDGEGGIGEEVDDVLHALFGIPERVLGKTLLRSRPIDWMMI